MITHALLQLSNDTVDNDIYVGKPSPQCKGLLSEITSNWSVGVLPTPHGPHLEQDIEKAKLVAQRRVSTCCWCVLTVFSLWSKYLGQVVFGRDIKCRTSLCRQREQQLQDDGPAEQHWTQLYLAKVNTAGNEAEHTSVMAAKCQSNYCLLDQRWKCVRRCRAFCKLPEGMCSRNRHNMLLCTYPR